MSEYVLNVRIDGPSEEAFLSEVRDILMEDNGGVLITTPNAEMLVRADERPYFRQVLNESNINICDSRGIELSSDNLSRLTGVDAMVGICQTVYELGGSLYLLGADMRTLEGTRAYLENRFAGIRVVGVVVGPILTMTEVGIEYDTDQNDNIIDDIIMTAPDVLFVAFGHEKQELWLYEHLPTLPSVKIGMGVGGAFDMLSGRRARAPQWMQTIGIEWLWRLIIEPRRFKRIFTAVVIFPFLLMTQKYVFKKRY
jgi:N-acetylglucosaminyldiphosphoundecaprenol N-acetyl-beta-D-mannosaminyltransferase